MKVSYLVIVSFIVISCRPEIRTVEELTTFVANEDHGLRKVAEVNGTKIEVVYRPTDLWVGQEVGDKPASPDQLAGLRRKYDQYLYFVLRLSREDGEALRPNQVGQYGDLVQTLSFHMPEYVNLTTSTGDSIQVGDFMLNRTYGMSSSTDLLFVFPKDKAKGEDWVQFNLNEFGLDVGNQRFRFDVDDLLNVPQVAFDI